MKLHTRFLAVVLACCAHTMSTAADVAHDGPATQAYLQRLADHVCQLSSSKLNWRFADLHYSPVRFTFRVRANGEVESVRLMSGRKDSLIAEVLLPAIKFTKFPPIPKSVLKEQHKNWLDPEMVMASHVRR
jgi:hypothetical protein